MGIPTASKFVRRALVGGSFLGLCGATVYQHYQYRALYGETLKNKEVNGGYYEYLMSAKHNDEPFLVRWSRNIILTGGFVLVRWIMHTLNTVKIEGEDRFHEYLRQAKKNRVGVLTVCNHLCTIDDPMITGLLNPPPSEILFNHSTVRWTICKTSICYKSDWASIFFGGLGKVMPIHMGGGVDQKELEVFMERLKHGEWLHVFPESRIWQESTGPHRDSEGCLCSTSGRKGTPHAKLGPFKWGIGKIILKSPVRPVVIPFFHRGIEKMYPLDFYCQMTQSIPTFGLDIEILVGEPVAYDDLAQAYDQLKESGRMSPEMERDYYRRVARRVEDAMLVLERKVHGKDRAASVSASSQTIPAAPTTSSPQ